MKQEGDMYLLRLKAAGWSNGRIASKMGISEEEVTMRIACTIAETKARLNCGMAALVDHFTVLCSQYQLLGESLKELARGIANEMPTNELCQLLERGGCSAGSSLSTAVFLKENAIVLRPYVPQEPGSQKQPNPTSN